MSMDQKAKKYAIRFLIVYFSLLVIIAVFNYIMDPYFVYRVSAFKAKHFSFNQTENSPTWRYGLIKQKKGFDAVWLGSSLLTSVDTKYADSKLGVNSVKLAIPSGRANIYAEFLRNALKYNDIKKVFFETNIKHWCWYLMGTEYDIDGLVEKYIRTDSMLDDGKYLLSRRVTEESTALATAWLEVKMGISLDDGDDAILPADSLYSTRAMEKKINANHTDRFTKDMRDEALRVGMGVVERDIVPLFEENPDIEFIFEIPPMGVATKAQLLQGDSLDTHLEIMEKMFTRLLQYPNVRIIASDLDYDYNMNTEHYMDTGHYDPEGGILLVDCIANGEHEITLDNIDERMQEYRDMAEDFKWPFLKIKFIGDQVTDLQEKLKALGYDVEVSGTFDKATEEAVKDIQKKNGIEPDGVVFSDTLDIIDRLVEKKRKN